MPFEPYRRDPETLARPWAIPGTPGLEHRIGGLEKADVTGTISYDPDNHDLMVRLRAQKVAGIAADIPELEVDDPDGDAELLVSAGARRTGRSAPPCGASASRACVVARAHLHHLNPFPRNTGDVLAPLREGARAGDEPRPARAAPARRVPRRRGLLHKVRGGRSRCELADAIVALEAA